MTIEGGTKKEVFCAYLQQCLLPKLGPGDCLVLDRLGAHVSQVAQDLLRAHKIEVHFLPPYSPDLNPIELSRVPGMNDVGTR